MTVKSENIVGKRYGRLVVLEMMPSIGIGRGKVCIVKVECECGTIKSVRARSLKRGQIVSCGCYNKEQAYLRAKKNIKHGKSYCPENRIWRGMKTRCLNKNGKRYKDYGGRGIVVCERWLNSFGNFLADMGERPSPQHSLDRVNNDGNYEPSNCRWATRQEQCNNRRGSVRYKVDNKECSLIELSLLAKINPRTIKTRIQSGMSLDEVISKPVKKYCCVK